MTPYQARTAAEAESALRKAIELISMHPLNAAKEAERAAEKLRALSKDRLLQVMYARKDR